MADLLSTYKSANNNNVFTGGPGVVGTGQFHRQNLGQFGFTSSSQVAAAVDSGLVTLSKEVKNSCGAYVFEVSPLDRCRRFLILGDAGKGSYYIGANTLLQQNLDCFHQVIADDQWQALIDMIVEISVKGLAPKQDTLIFALAWLSCHANEQVRAATYKVLGQVLRTPTDLFAFLFTWRPAIRGDGKVGWGAGLRRSVMRIYTEKSIKQLAYHMTKYQSRNGVSHRDVLRVVHPSVGGKRRMVETESDGKKTVRYVEKSEGNVDADRNLLFAWATNKGKLNDDMVQAHFHQKTSHTDFDVRHYLYAVEEALTTPNPVVAIMHIKRFGLVREQLSTSLLNDISVWGALLEKMPMTALLRNLGSMTAKGVFDIAEYCAKAIKTLVNEEAIQRAYIHPLNVYVALIQYQKGRGDKGKLTWTVNNAIVNALQVTLRLAFKYAPPTGKKILVAIDISGSMTWPTNNIQSLSNITSREAASVMSLALLNTTDPVEVCAFSNGLTQVPVRKDMSVIEFSSTVCRLPISWTDCSQPMLWALQQKKFDIDAFVVFTDNETNAHKSVKPFEALAHYAMKSGKRDAKLIVCGMASNGFSIADPGNPNMLDIVGLDASVPQMVNNFIAGRV